MNIAYKQSSSSSGGSIVRLFGVNLPSKKKVRASLPVLYGVGKNNVYTICSKTNVNPDARMYELSEDDLNRIKVYIEENIKVEGECRSEVSSNIKALVGIGCYRGHMHKKGLPVRGQRTKTNARTRKGRKKSFGKK